MAHDPQQMLDERRVQWHQFTRLVVYCAAGAAVLLILMALFLT